MSILIPEFKRCVQSYQETFHLCLSRCWQPTLHENMKIWTWVFIHRNRSELHNIVTPSCILHCSNVLHYRKAHFTLSILTVAPTRGGRVVVSKAIRTRPPSPLCRHLVSIRKHYKRPLLSKSWQQYEPLECWNWNFMVLALVTTRFSQLSFSKNCTVMLRERAHDLCLPCRHKSCGGLPIFYTHFFEKALHIPAFENETTLEWRRRRRDLFVPPRIQTLSRPPRANVILVTKRNSRK